MGYRNIKKQINLFLFFKLRIFIFQCPGTTHITNFTRMPLLSSPLTDNLALQQPSWEFCCLCHLCSFCTNLFIYSPSLFSLDSTALRICATYAKLWRCCQANKYMGTIQISEFGQLWKGEIHQNLCYSLQVHYHSRLGNYEI